MAAWSRRKDLENQLSFVPNQEAPAPPMTPALHEAAQHSVLVITTDGRVLKAGRAVLFILERLGYGWLARPLSLPPLIWAVELGYWLVARNRALFARFLFRKD